MIIPYSAPTSGPSLSRRNVYRVPSLSSASSSSTPVSDSNPNSGRGPSSMAVLIPLAISMTLVGLLVGLGIFLFMNYRRKQRIWLRDYALRRERERREKEHDGKEEKGPGMWEVEVREVEDEEDDEGDMPRRSFGDEQVVEWTGTPVSVTYRRVNSHLPSGSSLQSITNTTPPTPAAPTDSYEDTPAHVEMTFLIAMPSPLSSPSRSRRSSPASSGSNLELSRSQSSLDWMYGEHIPEVELATTIMPVRSRI